VSGSLMELTLQGTKLKPRAQKGHKTHFFDGTRES
jgi:hypothetical protein